MPMEPLGLSLPPTTVKPRLRLPGPFSKQMFLMAKAWWLDWPLRCRGRVQNLELSSVALTICQINISIDSHFVLNVLWRTESVKHIFKWKVVSSNDPRSDISDKVPLRLKIRAFDHYEYVRYQNKKKYLYFVTKMCAKILNQKSKYWNLNSFILRKFLKKNDL